MDDSPRSTIVDMETLGERLRAERKAAGLSQRELGKQAGVSKQAISQIELGNSLKPEAATLEPVARRLGLRTSWLLTGRLPKHAEDPDPSQHLGYEFPKMRAAITLLGYYVEIRGEPPEMLDDLESLHIAYDVVDAESRAPTGAELVDLTSRLAARLRERQEKADDDQRRKAQGTGGEDGGSRRRKAGKA